MATTRSSSNELSLSLPDEQKRLLCIELMQEFGIVQFRESRDGELTHRCTLPLGGHNDGNSWTASLNYKKLVFNCFVCGYGGSLTWWIAVNRGLTTEKAESWLKGKTGSGSHAELSTRLKILDAILHPPSNKPEPMPFYNDKILDRWKWEMQHPYLTDDVTLGGRGIPEANLNKYEVGYADEDEDFKYFRRIIIPVRWKGKIVGWQARRLDERDPEYDIKYKNSPSFPRDRLLYGDISARKAVVVESPMSVLRHTHQRPIVSTFGSKVTEAQIRLLERFSELTLFPDPDKAGYQWTRLLINKLSRSVRISVVESPYAKADAGDINDDDFEDLVSSAVPGVLWTPKYYHTLIPYKGIS